MIYSHVVSIAGRSTLPVLRSDLLRGTLDLLVLKTLTHGPQHGWGIAQAIRQGSGGVFEVQQGSLYPALFRMKRKGWVTSEWRVGESGRRARFYTLTATGRKQLGEEEATWSAASTAVNCLLGAYS